MKKLAREDLLSLEDYAVRREEFRREAMAHKRDRRLAIGPNVTLYFEDLLTIRYQVQEMLRAEKIFEAAGIAEELEAYNPLIPDGVNLKATMMIEFTDVDERRAALAGLGGIERKVWIEAAGGGRSFAIADEDMERSDPTRTSAVHFLRFELDAAAVAAIKSGGEVAMGVDHPRYTHRVDRLPEALLRSLAQDLD
ncbi:MAG: DUF3501 family protein [Gammaproteobacteria bacterium]